MAKKPRTRLTLTLAITLISSFEPSSGLTCNLPGECDHGDTYLGQTSANSPYDCLLDCQATAGCSWYQFEDASYTCLQLESCPEPSVGTCDYCTIGQVDCQAEYIGDIAAIGSDSNAGQSTEVINLDTSSSVQLPCNHPPAMAEGRGEHVATFSNGLLYICGGLALTFAFRDCSAYDNVTDSWSHKGEMDQPRRFAAGVLLSDTEFWITGGDDLDDDIDYGMDTSIIYDTSTDSFRPYVYLPQRMWQHTVLKVDEESYFIFGGDSYQLQPKPYMFYPETEEFKELPFDYTYNIYNGFAGLIETRTGKKEIVLHGGNLYPDLTFIFNLDTGEWRNGPLMQMPIAGGVSVPYGNSFLALGGYISSSLENEIDFQDGQYNIYRFDPDREHWDLVSRVLQDERYWFAAALVPPGFFQCF